METKTLLDNNRSRNIEIFLPSFPLSLATMETKLSEQLNNVNDSLELGSDHIVALKRYVGKVTFRRWEGILCLHVSE